MLCDLAMNCYLNRVDIICHILIAVIKTRCQISAAKTN